MTYDIEKLLAKITEKEKISLVLISEKVKNKDFTGLDIKKLSGYDDIFRIRKGKFRIIFQITKNDTKIISVDKRSDTTYNF